MTSLKDIARRLRDNPVVTSVLSFPLRKAKDAGFRVPRRIYERVPFRGDFTVRVSDQGEMFHIRSHGHVVENSLYWDGLDGFDAESLRPWMAFARESHVILDIGANTGVYSLAAAAVRSAAQIHAFEPVPRIAALMRTNVALNPSYSVSVHELAVGAEDGTANIFDPGGDNAYSASLNADFLASEKTSYPVRVTSIDSFVSEQQLTSVDLIKLDVEGYEEFALAGMWNTLMQFKPPIFLEFLDVREGHKPLIEKIAALMSKGYQLYQLLPEGLKRSRTIEAAPKGAYNVLLCIPERIPASIRATVS